MESTLHMTLISIYMVCVLVARPIISFHQTIDLVSGYPSYKGSEKVYLFNTENSNLVRRGIGGRLGVRDFHIVLSHGGDAHSSPDELVFTLRLIYHFRRPNLSQELAQTCGMSYHYYQAN